MPTVTDYAYLALSQSFSNRMAQNSTMSNTLPVTIPRVEPASEEEEALQGTQEAASTTTTYTIRLVPHLINSHALRFDPIERELTEGSTVRIGRFVDRGQMGGNITFKSKVVSRSHAEISVNHGKFYLKDTSSSSGTFLNHVRLSPPGQASAPSLLTDGDVVQLGVDYQGGVEELYKCVKMRLEVNRKRDWGDRSYCVAAFNSLRHLTTPPNASLSPIAQGLPNFAPLDTIAQETGSDLPAIDECVICLYAIAPFQALFTTPCSHTFHYKCIRPLLQDHPAFTCPICRTFADLEASVAVEKEDILSRLRQSAEVSSTPASPKEKEAVTHSVPMVAPPPLSTSPSSQTSPSESPDAHTPTPNNHHHFGLFHPHNHPTASNVVEAHAEPSSPPLGGLKNRIKGKVVPFLRRTSLSIAPTSPALERPVERVPAEQEEVHSRSSSSSAYTSDDILRDGQEVQREDAGGAVSPLSSVEGEQDPTRPKPRVQMPATASAS